jgi:acyl carrier protein
MKDAKKFLTKYFNGKAGSEKIGSNKDFLKSGLIDSLQFIIMIGDIEKRFKIKFSEKDLQSGGIRTISGLEKIINKLK